MPASDNNPFIRIAGLTHVYASAGTSPSVVALSDVNLAIQAGEYVALIGANGSGKTTLARHLNGLLLPTQGDVWIDGRNTREQSHLRAIRANVGMVFQSPEDQIVATIVEEDVAFGPENLGVPEAELALRVRQALKTVGMWEQRQRPPHLLSAGQQQRVAIAGALAMNPRCLVLDEATAMLDPAGRRALLQLLDDLHAAGLTIVTVTHFMEEAARAQRIVALDRGQIALDGPPAEIFADGERLAPLHLGLPPAAELAARLRRRFPSLPAGLLTSETLAHALAPLAPCLPLPPSPHLSPESPGEGRRADHPLIEVHDLHHTYLAGTPLAHAALRGVNAVVWPGEVVGMIGATGSGKSTLLQHVNGLLRPQAGRVRVDGHDLNDPGVDLRAVRQTVGLVFQRPEDQLFERYVGDDVAYGPRLAGLAHAELRERVRWAMEMVGLDFEAYKDRLTFTLSGGERRKAALAGVLALRPQVLALDEPTAGLDPTAHAELLAQLARLRQQGHTLVIATHTMDDVAALADRVYVLADGQVALHGPTRQVFAQVERLRTLGLDVPAAVDIATSLRSAGVLLPALLTLDEAEIAIGQALAAGTAAQNGQEAAL
ncbi:MAG: energy-coupling factor transporter ATPase [Chloroflexi bacterium]|nr:energy-coupling factor transporter ATPase [Chloroflexota bacterium]